MSTVCEQMFYQSQSSTFLNEFFTDTDNQKINISPDSQLGLITGVPNTYGSHYYALVCHRAQHKTLATSLIKLE